MTPKAMTQPYLCTRMSAKMNVKDKPCTALYCELPLSARHEKSPWLCQCKASNMQVMYIINLSWEIFYKCSSFKNLTKIYLLPLPDHPQLQPQATHMPVTPSSLEVICHSQYHSKSIVAKTTNHCKQMLNVTDRIHIVRINIDIFNVFTPYWMPE